MSTWLFTLVKLARRLWVRASLFSVFALLAVSAALWLGPYVPGEIADRFGGDGAASVLSVLSSSMLVIATFSLGTMVSGYTAAATSATPRAASILVTDDYAQNAISTFIGAFLYAVVAQIALDSNVFSAGDRTVLFFVTLLIMALVIATLVRWIDDLSRVGQVRETLAKVEQEACRAIDQRARQPNFGGRPFDDLPAGHDVCADYVGYVQSVDFDALEQAIDGEQWTVYLLAEPGMQVHRHRALVRLCGAHGRIPAEIEKVILDCFTIGDARTPMQDSRFGLTILAEAASRALSPGVNDPGTAIDVALTAARCLDTWFVVSQDCDRSVTRPWLYANNLSLADLLECAFQPIVQYGAGQVEVMQRLLVALDGLAALDASYREAVQSLAGELLERARSEIRFDADLARLERTRAGLTALSV